jgi:hypothetical protein
MVSTRFPVQFPAYHALTVRNGTNAKPPLRCNLMVGGTKPFLLGATQSFPQGIYKIARANSGMLLPDRA